MFPVGTDNLLHVWRRRVTRINTIFRFLHVNYFTCAVIEYTNYLHSQFAMNETAFVELDRVWLCEYFIEFALVA